MEGFFLKDRRRKKTKRHIEALRSIFIMKSRIVIQFGNGEKFKKLERKQEKETTGGEGGVDIFNNCIPIKIFIHCFKKYFTFRQFTQQQKMKINLHSYRLRWSKKRKTFRVHSRLFS